MKPSDGISASACMAILSYMRTYTFTADQITAIQAAIDRQKTGDRKKCIDSDNKKCYIEKQEDACI